MLDNYNQLNEFSARLVEFVFAQFYLLCRGSDVLFADESRLKAEKTLWCAAFTRDNLRHPDQIQRAMRSLERHKFHKPPQLGEFLSWNEPTLADYDFLPKEQAYNRAYQLMRDGGIAGMSDDQLAVLEHAIRESDRHFLKTNHMNKTQPVFYRNYEIAVRDFMAGKLKSIAKGIEDKSSETAEIEKQNEIKKGFENLKDYASNMNRMKEMLGMKENGAT